MKMKSNLAIANHEAHERGKPPRSFEHLSFGTTEVSALNYMAATIHKNNVQAGWWTDLATGMPKDRNTGELLMLAVSELAEAMEGDRKDLMDDKLPQYKMFDVELADTFIRLMDMAGARLGHGQTFGQIVFDKLAYNASRADHKIENRVKADGKKY